MVFIHISSVGFLRVTITVGAMDMSLDDYINSFKQTQVAGPLDDSSDQKESKFKEGRREQNELEQDEEEELVFDCQQDGYVSLALQNDELALMETEPNDLRNKITANMPGSTSQQWRLMQPNVMHSRPAGMPPLIPTAIPHNGISGNRSNNHWRNYNYKNRNQFSGRNWNDRSNCRNNNNRIQRFSNKTRSNLNNKNIQIVLQQLKERNPLILYPQVDASDLTIEATTNTHSPRNGYQKLIPTIVKPNRSGSVLEPAIGVEVSSSEAIKSLIGVNETALRNEMMPALAGKLLDFLNGVNPTLHKPKYDMKIQKEIHDIQKKPLLYKCPGGEVVSSDGVGIADCKIQPRTSGVSLNNRFA